MSRGSARLWSGPVSRWDSTLVVGLALLARLAVAVWAASRFPPADDGTFYHVVASRIAQGLGYTWLWPDGVVTYAAHYPVGYPAIVGAAYAAFGAHPAVAMFVNAGIGTLGVWAVHRLAASVGLRGPALLAGLVAALHPGLVFYTPALMTEGVAASLFAVVGASCLACRERGAGPFRLRWLGLGLVSGVLVLVRPQALLFVPIAGALVLAQGSFLERLRSSLLVTLVSLAVCAPWTIRNCVRLERCVFVSANGGWNLFIGSAERATGTWVALDELGVPAECRTVFAEAEKDVCFGRAGVRNVLAHPGRFLALVPRKLSATFDFSGAPVHYLSASNSALFRNEHKYALGAAEVLVERLVLLLALVGVGRGPGSSALLRNGVLALAVPWVFLKSAWVAHVLLLVGAGLHGRGLGQRPLIALGAGVVAVTALTHAVFFGAERYGLVCALLLVGLGAEAFRKPPPGQAAWPLFSAFRRLLTARRAAEDTAGHAADRN